MSPAPLVSEILEEINTTHNKHTELTEPISYILKFRDLV